MENLVRTERAEGVATVTVANPPANALADAVIEALGAVAAELAEDGGTRAVVLTGAGKRIFLAGADLNEFSAALGDAEAMEAHAGLTREVFSAWARLPVPVIAAVGGHAMGGGLEMALVCDLIVADPRAKLGLPEVSLGLVPGAGGTQRLPRRVGVARATRMLLLNELLDASEACAAGLVDQVSEPGEALAAARELAVRIAAAPGRATEAAKRALLASARMPLEEGLAVERQAFLEVAASADAREGVAAFLEKRKPEFRHR